MTNAWQSRTTDAAVLTDVLHAAGVASESRIREIAVESDRTTAMSRIIRLRLAYEGDAPVAPASIILKTAHPDRAAAGWAGARREVEFYAHLASRAPGRETPRCFEAFADEATQDWHLLLEDLTDTHATAGDWPLPPPLPVCERIVESHARHQAMHWDAPHLGLLKADWRWRDEVAAAAYVGRLSAQCERFFDRLGDRLPPERRALYEGLIEAAPRLADRYRAGRHLTVVQGDAHPWNCLLPKAEGEARLFDWDAWRIDVGASDLAQMMAVQWYPDRRRRAERPLLDRYHAALLANGVKNYDRDALDEDYRFAVLWQMTWPLGQEAYGVPTFYWWNNLERVMLAIEDWDCAALLR